MVPNKFDVFVVGLNCCGSFFDHGLNQLKSLLYRDLISGTVLVQNGKKMTHDAYSRTGVIELISLGTKLVMNPDMNVALTATMLTKHRTAFRAIARSSSSDDVSVLKR